MSPPAPTRSPIGDHRRWGCALVALLLGVAACPRSPPPPSDLAAPLDLTMPAPPDLAVPPPPPPIDRIQCREAKCLPPPCCGAACQDDSQCCRGTLCAKEGRCAPALCRACGEIGCTVDYAKCTAGCAKAACCLKPCTSDGDCCPGTRCDANSKGERLCTPKFCDSCGGLAPICSVSPQCEARCTPPASCGTPCVDDQVCGARSSCRTFLGGERLCVPAAFEPACIACGARGCLFFPDRCAVECKLAPADLGAAPDGAARDGAVPRDAAAVEDANAAVIDAATGDGGGACKGCCQRCASDRDCCPGHLCEKDDRGDPTCLPALCKGCQFGCSFFCPPG